MENTFGHKGPKKDFHMLFLGKLSADGGDFPGCISYTVPGICPTGAQVSGPQQENA